MSAGHWTAEQCLWHAASPRKSRRGQRARRAGVLTTAAACAPGGPPDPPARRTPASTSIGRPCNLAETMGLSPQAAKMARRAGNALLIRCWRALTGRTRRFHPCARLAFEFSRPWTPTPPALRLACDRALRACSTAPRLGGARIPAHAARMLGLTRTLQDVLTRDRQRPPGRSGRRSVWGGLDLWTAARAADDPEGYATGRWPAPTCRPFDVRRAGDRGAGGAAVVPAMLALTRHWGGRPNDGWH